MYLNGASKKRRGVGSIIAGAFLVLILLSGYEFYLLNNRTQNDYQQVLNEKRELDIEKGQEDLKFTNIVPEFTSDVFKLTIRNDGPELVQIRYAAIFKEGEAEAQYFELDQNPVSPYDAPNIMPAEVITVQLDDGTTNIIEDTRYTLQIITDRGNVFPIQYPQETENYPYGYILSGAISKVIGRVVPIYDTFKWGLMLKNDNTVPSMKSTWVVELDNQDNHIFCVVVSHYGETPLVLGSKTGLYFKPISGTGSPVECYIVHYDSTTDKVYSYEGNEMTLPKFDPEEEEEPTQHELYFSTTDEGSDPIIKNFAANKLGPSGTRYQITLGIFDDEEIYAQSFPLIAIEVENEK